jgi:cell pole-organizing protein PopZ
VEIGMSKAMSEREIEDVLDSVRRLVAQEERRSRVPPLVLTPQMRIRDEEDAPVDTAARAPDATEPTPSAAPAGGPADPAEPAAAPTENLPQTGAGPSLPMTMDDAAMQEMVAQIVRDELQGKLGERITLAVRKLVRNEIARAMDEQRRK